MDFEKSMSFNLPCVAVDEDALRSIEAVLSKSGPCKYWYYQDAFDTLDALLASRELPLDRIELGAPAATVSIYRSGVTIQHLPDAHAHARELERTILKFEIPSLARLAVFYQLILLVGVLAAVLRDDFVFMMVTCVVGALLEHIAKGLVVKSPIVKLPFGMRLGKRIEILIGATAAMVLIAIKFF